jgi:hypothetical protein
VRGRWPVPLLALDYLSAAPIKTRKGQLTVNGVADEEESDNSVDKGSARSVLALKVTLLVASERVGSSRLLGSRSLGELCTCTFKT